MVKTGIIFDLKRFALKDGPGIRTTVFFKGCCFTCPWCHNPEGQSFHVEAIVVEGIRTFVGTKIDSLSLFEEIMKDLDYYGNNGGVTFSGGEPFAQVDFLDEMLILAKQAQLNTVVDTSGCFRTEDLARVIDHVDLFHFDLKILEHDRAKQLLGLDSCLIQKNFNLIAKQKDIIVRIPLVSGYTDSERNIDQICDLLRCNQKGRIKEIVLLPYHFLGVSKYKRLAQFSGSFTAPTRETIEHIKQKLTEFGLPVYLEGF